MKAILEDGVDFTVTVNRPKWWRAKERKFIIKPLYLGTLARISKKLLEMSPTSFDTSRLELGALDAAIKGMSLNMNHFVYILAAAVHNQESEPPKSLQKFFMENLTPSEARTLLGLVISMLGVTDFLASMASMNALSLVGAIPNTIHGPLSEASLNTSESRGETASGA